MQRGTGSWELGAEISESCGGGGGPLAAWSLPSPPRRSKDLKLQRCGDAKMGDLRGSDQRKLSGSVFGHLSRTNVSFMSVSSPWSIYHINSETDGAGTLREKL